MLRRNIFGLIKLEVLSLIERIFEVFATKTIVINGFSPINNNYYEIKLFIVQRTKITCFWLEG